MHEAFPLFYTMIGRDKVYSTGSSIDFAVLDILDLLVSVSERYLKRDKYIKSGLNISKRVLERPLISRLEVVFLGGSK